MFILDLICCLSESTRMYNVIIIIIIIVIIISENIGVVLYLKGSRTS